MSERKLTSIQRIVSIEPIQGADKIELATVLGWQCVVKKDEFKIGDLCVYIEIDSIVPADNPYFEFLKDRKYRVRTIRLRGQISQGLVCPLNIMGLKTSKWDENRVYKFDGTRWMEINKDVSDSYLYDEEYIKHLVKKIEIGEYDVELLSENEKAQIENYLSKNNT